MISGIVGVLIALVLAVRFGRLGFLAVSAKSWPSVPGKIVSSGEAKVRYLYRVGARELTGETLFFGDFIERNVAVMKERKCAWPVGKDVSVLHHPERPELCCLEPRADQRVWLFFGGALMLAGVVLKTIDRG